MCFLDCLFALCVCVRAYMPRNKHFSFKFARAKYMLFTNQFLFFHYRNRDDAWHNVKLFLRATVLNAYAFEFRHCMYEFNIKFHCTYCLQSILNRTPQRCEWMCPKSINENTKRNVFICAFCNWYHWRLSLCFTAANCLVGLYSIHSYIV